MYNKVGLVGCVIGRDWWGTCSGLCVTEYAWWGMLWGMYNEVGIVGYV